MNRTVAVAIAFIAIMGLGAAPAWGVPVTATDFSTIALGTQVAPTTTRNFIAPDGAIVGTLTNNVYLNNGVYTYVHFVTTGLNGTSEVNTAFGVTGFNGVAGFDFAQAAAAGGGFNIDRDPDGTIDWEATFDSWNNGEAITFFFQSNAPPTEGNYNIIDGGVGQGTSYAPVPEPASLFLLGAGLIGLGFVARRARKS